MARLALVVGVLTVGIWTRTFSQSIDDTNERRRIQDDPIDSADDDRRFAYSSSSPTAQRRPLISGPLSLTECYVCTDCPSVDLNSTFKMCPYVGDVSKNNKCIIYAEQYQHMNRPWYIRGCVSERGSCADVRFAHDYHNNIVKLLSCQECEGDKCNGVSRSIPTVTGFLVLVVTPLVAKHTLS